MVFMPHLPHPDQEAGTAKRGRGRPPSANKALDTTAANRQHSAPRKRGRPPKLVSSQIKKVAAGTGHRGRPRVYPVDYAKVEKLALLLTPAEKQRLVATLSTAQKK